MTDTAITVTIAEGTAPVLNAMVQQAAVVDHFWSRHQPDLARKCVLSLARQIPHMLTSGFGDATVYRDGDLSLYVTSGIKYGVIGHRLHRPDAVLDTDLPTTPAPMLGRYCYRDESSSEPCLKPIEHGKPTCDHANPVIVAAPVPIEWSFHS